MSAWCELDGGYPTRFGKDPNESVLEMVRARWTPSVEMLAIEMVQSFGMPVGQEVFATVLWVGRFLEAWAHRGGEVKLVYRKDVKLFHCESVRATDANIRAAIIDRFGPGKSKAIGTKAAKGPLYGLKGDEWSALAVALKAAA